MPWIAGESNSYQIPLMVPANHDCTQLDAWRKYCQQNFEELKKHKKYDAEFFKEESNYWRKAYRGACYAIGWLSANPPKDCLGLQANKEIAPFIDAAFARVIYA